LLRSPSGQQLLLSISSGSAQLVLNTGDIAELEVTLPEQTEAMAIAEILSSLDDKIELNLQTNKTLEEMANALYKHWFVDFGPFQEGKFIESELGLIPEGFKSVSFKDVCFNHSKTYNFKGKEKVVFVNTGDILEGKFLHNNYSDVEGLPGQAKKIIEPDDILFSEIRPGNKRYALIISDTSDYVVSTKFMVIRTNENILPRILYRILREEKIIKEFQSIAESRSGTFPQITFDAISGISFPMSNIEIQNQFMEKVLPLEQLIDSNNIEIESLKQTRDYLLPKLISGEIRLKDAAKKVKEVL
jgi:type I restriction enzyme S subunit